MSGQLGSRRGARGIRIGRAHVPHPPRQPRGTAMLKTIAQWERARLFRHSPGARGLVLLSCLPLLHLLPWRGTEFFESTFQASVMLSSLFALIATCVIGRDAGAPRRSLFWLFQKGVPPLDYALGAFLVTFGSI